MNVAGESNPFSWILLNGIFLVGSYVFAVVLGLVSDDTSQELKVPALLHVAHQQAEISQQCPTQLALVWHCVPSRDSLDSPMTVKQAG